MTRTPLLPGEVQELPRRRRRAGLAFALALVSSVLFVMAALCLVAAIIQGGIQLGRWL